MILTPLGGQLLGDTAVSSHASREDGRGGAVRLRLRTFRLEIARLLGVELANVSIGRPAVGSLRVLIWRYKGDAGRACAGRGFGTEGAFAMPSRVPQTQGLRPCANAEDFFAGVQQAVCSGLLSLIVLQAIQRLAPHVKDLDAVVHSVAWCWTVGR